ncbi:histidine kinase [Parafrankia sp. EAN1pec]|nr:histidine kinase [Frankia sp. EAN1pec]
MDGRRSCQTGPVIWAAIRRHRERAGPASLTVWAWVADAILALVLALGVVTAINGDRLLAVPAPGTSQSARVERPSRPVLPLTRVTPVPPVEPVPSVAPEPREVPSLAGPGQVFPSQFVAVQTPVADWQLALAVLAALPLAARRRFPLATYGCVIAAASLLQLDLHIDDLTTFTFTACLIAGYSAAMYSPHRAWAAAGIAGGAVLLALGHHTTIPRISSDYFPFLVLIPLGLAANAAHTRTQRARVQEAERAAASRQATDQERARIARELHDVVTHNVSVMVIQAGAARKVLDANPDLAREAIRAVETSGRSAMTELRHVMGLLTMSGGAPDGGDDGPGPSPQPGLGRVDELVRRVRDTGVDVELSTTGTPVPLPAGVDLAAFRVVQEALTNAVRHAAGARVRVAVAYAPGLVRVEVTDSGGVRAAAAGAGSGAGLLGLRERLAVYGGTLAAGPRPTGGYRVMAEIPLDGP